MRELFGRQRALAINLWGLALVLVLLIATPVRSHVVVAVLMLYAVGYLVAHRASLAFTRLDWMVVGLLSLMVLSRIPVFIIDDFASRYLSPGLHMAAVIPVYLMLRHLLWPVDVVSVRRFMEWGTIIGCLGAFAVAVYQTQIAGNYRADGFLFSINLGYLSCSMAFLAASLIRDGRHRRWLLVAALAGSATCLLTLTRGAILALPLLLIFLLLLNVDRLGWGRILASVVGLVVLAMVSYATLPAVERRVDYSITEFTSIAEGNIEAAVSSGGRLQLWTAASHAFLERPLVGLTYDERVALNTELVERGVITEWVLGVGRGHAHSQYFEMAATGGLLGLIALIGYLVVPGIYHLRHYLADRSNPWSQVAVVFTAGFAIYSLTEAAIHHEMMVVFYSYMQVLLLTLSLMCRAGASPDVAPGQSEVLRCQARWG